MTAKPEPPAGELREPWLVAAWPGMGAIAQVAGGYLAAELRARQIGEIRSEAYFEVQSIEVENGLARAGELPRNRLFAWKDPAGRRDLLLFLGEMQPALRGASFCDELLASVEDFGVSRIVTFAAIASPIPPQADPRVLAVANEKKLLDELREKGVELLQDGQITGLNGLLLASAAAHGLGAICLLGEFPYFASAVPNPKSSAAVLRVFADLAGIQLDMKTLDEQGKLVERGLVEQLNRLQQAAGAQTEEAPEFDPGKPDELDPEVVARIETLFREAERDRERALALKAELDRHGLFKRYEDRFLDLFKRAE